MSIEVSTDELVDLCLCGSVEILEFMHCLEFDDVQTIGKYTVRLAFEQVFRLISSDMGYGCEHISAMS